MSDGLSMLCSCCNIVKRVNVENAFKQIYVQPFDKRHLYPIWVCGECFENHVDERQLEVVEVASYD